MNIRHLTLPLIASMALLLSACSKEDAATQTAAPATAIAPAQAYEAVAAQGKGFTVGALMSANPVYVLFDPQCPHCGHLWNASLPLQGKVKFVWLPVAILGPKSAPQGAALMQAANPLEAMTAHEASVLAGQGGMSASASVPDEVLASIKANTQLLDNLGADSVPFIVAKHARSGQSVTKAGALDTRALAELLGLAAP
jgi:thiol:disulfide interchange protein DsbG